MSQFLKKNISHCRNRQKRFVCLLRIFLRPLSDPHKTWQKIFGIQDSIAMNFYMISRPDSSILLMPQHPMHVQSLRSDLQNYLKVHNLDRKWKKALGLFEEDIRHPSLHTELLEPTWRGIYSFRLDRKYRALFFIRSGIAEVFQITNHYKK